MRTVARSAIAVAALAISGCTCARVHTPAPDGFVAPDAPLRSCGGRIPPPPGPLACEGGTCRLVAHTIVDPPAFRGVAGRPSIAVGADGAPRILYSREASGAPASRRDAVLATRDAGGAWSSIVLPFLRDEGALVLGTGGCGYVFASVEPITGSLYHLDGDVPTLLDRLDGYEIGAGRLLLDERGGLLAIGSDRSWDCMLIERDGGAFTAAPSVDCSMPAAVALGPDGSVHTAWLEVTSRERIRYAHGGTSAEEVFAGGSSTFSPRRGPPIELAVAADGEPRILFSDVQASVWLARRRAGVWEPTLLGRSDCVGSGCSDGVDFECAGYGCGGYVPIGLVAGADGGVVGLVAMHGTWDGPGTDWPHALYVVTETATGPRMDVVADGVGGIEGTLAVGPDGHLHAAWYEPAPGAPPLVRYVELAP